MKTVTILSGGLDSTTLAYHLASFGDEQAFLSFDYGQRHRRELDSAVAIASALNKDHRIIDLTSFGKLIKNSSITGSIEMPHGHYSQENMKATVVPNRNAIMLSLAWGVAVATNAEHVAYGAHLGDRAQYPDCRKNFVEALEGALKLGTEGFGSPNLRLFSPFVNITKADVVRIGLELAVPFELTWSCYMGGEKACGRCGTCVERLEAFDINKAIDPIEYADRRFWKKAIADFDVLKEVSNY